MPNDFYTYKEVQAKLIDFGEQTGLLNICKELCKGECCCACPHYRDDPKACYKVSCLSFYCDDIRRLVFTKAYSEALWELQTMLKKVESDYLHGNFRVGTNMYYLNGEIMVEKNVFFVNHEQLSGVRAKFKLEKSIFDSPFNKLLYGIDAITRNAKMLASLMQRAKTIKQRSNHV